jgi:hypothetical protein
VQQHQHRRRVHVVGRPRELEPLEQHRQRELRLEERQVLPDAHPGAEAEGDERQRMRRRPRRAAGEAARVEPRGVGAPERGVVVHRHDRDQQLGVPRDGQAAEDDVALRAADGGHRRRVQAERLVQDHAQLQWGREEQNKVRLFVVAELPKCPWLGKKGTAEVSGMVVV